jgi:hypothetical protein
MVKWLSRSIVITLAFLTGWQIGIFACDCVDPSERHGCCQAPKCQDYSPVCPSGWIFQGISDPYRCCRTYTGSHRLYGDPPCCEWHRPYDPGCRHFRCFRPPYGPSVIHCARRNTTRYGNWENGDIWICEAIGETQPCAEKHGWCTRLEQ